jgi:spore coat protein H
MRSPRHVTPFIASILLLVAFSASAFAQVPDFSVSMTPDDHDSLFTRDVFDDSYLPGPFTSRDTTWAGAQIRFKGNSTRYYAKKSYRVRTTSSTLYYGQRALNFNSMYTDKSLMREKLAWDIFHDLGALAPTAMHANFSINGEPKGLYALIPKVDKYFLAVNGRTEAPMYEADDYWNLADLTVRPDSLLKLYYAKEIGPSADYSDLARLIAALNGAPDGSFADTVRHYFDTTSILRWFAVNTLTMMGDSYNKNYLLYRDTSRAAQQWTIIPWDYDLSWGRTGDLAIPYPSSLLNDGFAYTFSPLSGPDNVLKDRFIATPELWNGFRAYLAGVLDTVFTEARLWPRIDSLAALIRPSAAADPERWGTMQDFDEHVEALKYYVTARRSYLLKTFINPPSGEYDIATLPFAGEGVPHHFVGYDGRLIGTLWVTGVTGLDSVTVRAWPDSMPPDVTTPGEGNWVRRWVEIVRHPPTAEFTAKFRWAYKHVSSTDTEAGAGVADERILRPWLYDGISWSGLGGRVNSFANTVTIDSLPSHQTGGGQYLALLVSETYDKTWERQANDYWERWHDVRFADSLHGYVVGEHGSFLRTSDGGDTWERDSIGSALHFFSIDLARGSGRLTVAGESGGLSASTDTGATWIDASPGAPGAVRAVTFDGDQGVAAGDGGSAFFTPDGGSSWLDAVTGVADDFQAARYRDAWLDTFIAVGPQIRIFTELLVPLPVSAFTLSTTIASPHPLHAVDLFGSSFWVAGDSGFVGLGALSDTFLADRSLPDPVRIKGIVALDGSRLYVAGEGGAIYYTADEGLSWVRQLTGDTHDLEAIAFTGTGRGFAVGNDGTILRTDVPGTLTGVAGEGPAVPAAFRLHQNYPNPFNPSTTIAFDLPVDAAVSIEIFDLLGRRVAAPMSAGTGGVLPAGSHAIVWDAAGRSSGVYFAVMQATGRAGNTLFRDAKKLLLVR